MSANLFRWLILLALLVAPLGMIGGAAAAAHVQTMAAGHCAETDKSAQAPPAAPADCMIACAGCLPAQTGTLSARPGMRAAVRPAPAPYQLRGLHPEAATPPPRFS